jgi:hypothetical protein
MIAERKIRVPGGRPIPNVTLISDVNWALDKARRYIFRGGDPNNSEYREYVDAWLDYMNELNNA